MVPELGLPIHLLPTMLDLLYPLCPELHLLPTTAGEGSIVDFQGPILPLPEGPCERPRFPPELKVQFMAFLFGPTV